MAKSVRRYYNVLHGRDDFNRSQKADQKKSQMPPRPHHGDKAGTPTGMKGDSKNED